TVALNPGTARKFARDFGYADRRLDQDIAFRYRAASRRNIGANWPKSMEPLREALKKLNVFASMQPKYPVSRRKLGPGVRAIVRRATD
ncbi:MAG: hypothetical protein WB420_20315, partial [Bradyrhizobium sp.]